VTPTHYVPQIIAALDAAKEQGFSLPVVYNCGGYELPDRLKWTENAWSAACW
jgi:putative pyruvate formate lyase activating enzyme